MLTTNALFPVSNQTSIARRLEVDNLPNLNKPDNRIYTEVMNTLFFFNKNVVFPAQAEYSYFSADFRLKIFLYYS